jgi:hypothetical protein
MSDDGVNDKVPVPPATGLVIDIASDSQSVSGDRRLSLAQGTQLWIKGTASTGLVYASTMYQGG